MSLVAKSVCLGVFCVEAAAVNVSSFKVGLEAEAAEPEDAGGHDAAERGGRDGCHERGAEGDGREDVEEQGCDEENDGGEAKLV